MIKNRNMFAIAAGLLTITGVIAGCGENSVPVTGAVENEGTATSSQGISLQKFADAVHAVMMADRTVYATHVVTRLQKQQASVKPSEYWQDEDHTIPLPAQMFRMGAELVNESPTAGFTYSLKSQWPLNPQNKAGTAVEVEGLKYVSENVGENFYGEESLGDQKYFVAIYPDRAVAKACWDCHNDHANKGIDYPVFQQGDVMGGVVVRVPIP